MQAAGALAAAPGTADPKSFTARPSEAAVSKKAQVGGFNSKEAERWLESRWKSLQSGTASSTQKAEVYKATPGTGGSAWGPNKKTVNDKFCTDLAKAAKVAGL